MMKKISKLALLAAATAFLLAAFPACSNDDDEDNETEQGGGGSSGGGDGGGAETPPIPPSGKTTTGSWDFANQADTIDWVAKFNTNTITKESDGTRSLDKSGDISIASEALDADTDGLTLTILAEKAWSGATAPNYSYAEPASGLRIKNPAFKIAGVKGKVKVTIAWECIHGKDAGARKLQLLKADGTIVKEAGNDATTSASSGNVAMTPFETTVSYTESTDLYIGGTDNIFIKNVKVENAAEAVTTVTLKIPDAQGNYADGQTLTFEMGNAKLSATALNTAIKESTEEAVQATVGIAVNALQTMTNEELGDKTFTVTKAHLDFIFAESEAKLDAEECLTEITGGSTVYVSFEPNDAYKEACAAATVTGVNAKWDFKADSAKDAAWLADLTASGDKWKFDENSDVKGKVQDEENGVSITPTTGSGANFTFLKTSKSIESGGSNGWKTGTSKANGTASDFTAYATITVTANCTVTLTGKGGGKSEDSSKGVRGFAVNDGDTDVVKWEQNNTTASENFPSTNNSFSAVPGKTYTIKAAGVNFYSIACTPAE